MKQEDFTERLSPLKHRLYRIAYLYLGHEQSALDCVDESVYKAYKYLHQLREDAFFETWLTRILINECKKERRLLSLFALPIKKDLPKETFDVLPLKEAIHQLPKPLREVIILRYFEDFTLSQTAEILNIPQGTIVTRQRKALHLLKLELSEEDSHEPLC